MVIKSIRIKIIPARPIISWQSIIRFLAHTDVFLILQVKSPLLEGVLLRTFIPFVFYFNALQVVCESLITVNRLFLQQLIRSRRLGSLNGFLFFLRFPLHGRLESCWDHVGESCLIGDVGEVCAAAMGFGSVWVLGDWTLGRGHAEHRQLLVLRHLNMTLIQQGLPTFGGLSREQGPSGFAAVTASFGLVFSAARPPHVAALLVSLLVRRLEGDLLVSGPRGRLHKVDLFEVVFNCLDHFCDDYIVTLVLNLLFALAGILRLSVLSAHDSGRAQRLAYSITHKARFRVAPPMQPHRLVHEPLYLYFLDLEVFQFYYLVEFVDLDIFWSLMISIRRKWALHNSFIFVTHRVYSLFKSSDSWKQSLNILILMAGSFLTFWTNSWGNHGGSIRSRMIFWLLLLLKPRRLKISNYRSMLTFENLSGGWSVEGLKLLISRIRTFLSAERWSLGSVSRLSTKPT